MREYDVASSDDCVSFCRLCDDFLDRGFDPVGGINCMIGNPGDTFNHPVMVYSQAFMVHYED